MITGLKEEMNIKYLSKVKLFHLELKGIPFGLSHKELQFLSDLITIMLRDNPEVKERRRNENKNGRNKN